MGCAISAVLLIAHEYPRLEELRRALGEFYTPDWLAEEAVGRALEGLDVETAVLTDPTCGSGTFLLQAIARKRGDPILPQEAGDQQG